jgi:hypothetical protein
MVYLTMKRIALITVAVLSAVSAVPAVAFGGSNTRRAGADADAASTTAPRSQLTGFDCHRAFLPTGRSVTVRAVMRPITGTERMQIRFELLSNSSSTGVGSVAGKDLNTWISPLDPTLGQLPGDRWIIPIEVRNLPAPADYHYRVSFRWIGTRGRVLATKTRRTADCFQPELRPDVVLGSIAVEPIPAKPAKEQYVATIANKGRTAASGFAVMFASGGSVPITKIVQRLAAGAIREVTFVGPTCGPATAPTIVVDPSQTVPQADYTDDALAVPATCPTLTSAPAVAL